MHGVESDESMGYQDIDSQSANGTGGIIPSAFGLSTSARVSLEFGVCGRMLWRYCLCYLMIGSWLY